MSTGQAATPGSGGARVLRWLLVLPVGLLGWLLGVWAGGTVQGLLLGACAGDGAASSCPAAADVAWYLGVAVAAVLMVLLPVIAAPSMRGAVAWSAFALGLAAAGHDGWMEHAWGEMLVTALAGFGALLLSLRRWRGDGRAAAVSRTPGEERWP